MRGALGNRGRGAAVIASPAQSPRRPLHRVTAPLPSGPVALSRKEPRCLPPNS